MTDAEKETLERWASEMERLLSTSHGSEKRYYNAVGRIEAVRSLLAEVERLRAFEREADEIRNSHGWKRDGRPLPECVTERLQLLEVENERLADHKI